MAKLGLTPEQHKTLGAELAAMRNRLVSIDVMISNAYPLASKPVHAAHRSYAAIDELRSMMDDVLFKDYPEWAKPTVYYPAPDKDTK